MDVWDLSRVVGILPLVRVLFCGAVLPTCLLQKEFHFEPQFGIHCGNFSIMDGVCYHTTSLARYTYFQALFKYCRFNLCFYLCSCIIGMRSWSAVSILGLVMCVVGETMRKLAIATAAKSFNHVVEVREEFCH